MTDESEPTLVQLHWQNPNDLRQTEFVAQGGFDNVTAFEAWSTDLLDRRGSECPKGWGPMICTQDSEFFVFAAKEG